jgi:hypothetical protein
MEGHVIQWTLFGGLVSSSETATNRVFALRILVTGLRIGNSAFVVMICHIISYAVAESGSLNLIYRVLVVFGFITNYLIIYLSNVELS